MLSLWIFTALIAIVILMKIIGLFIEYKAHREFASRFGIDDDHKMTGIIDKLRVAYKNEDTEMPIKFRQEMAKRHNGNHMWKLLPNVFYWIINEPEMAKFMMNLDAKLIEKGSSAKNMFSFDKNGFKSGLLFSEGDQWKTQRKSLSENFSKRNVETFIEEMDKSACIFTEQLTLSSGYQNTEVIGELSNNCLFEIMFKCLMGDQNCNSQQSENHHDFIQAFETISKTVIFRVENRFKTMIFAKLPILNTFSSYFVPQLIAERRALKVRDEFLAGVVESAKIKFRNWDDKPVNDLASTMIAAQDKNGNRVFTDKEIKCQLFTFAFGGHETSASALNWLLFYLGQYPEWVKRINDEFEANQCTINRFTLYKCPTADAVIKETLRLCHTLDVFIPRVVKENIKLPDGTICPKGMTYMIDLANMNTDESSWGKNCLNFDPSRFLKSSKNDNLHSYQYLPFGGGKRSCIGKTFAMQELRILVLRICQNVKIENVMIDQNKIQPPNQWTGMTWKIKRGSLLQRFTPRE